MSLGKTNNLAFCTSFLAAHYWIQARENKERRPFGVELCQHHKKKKEKKKGGIGCFIPPKGDSAKGDGLIHILITYAGVFPPDRLHVRDTHKNTCSVLIIIKEHFFG